MFAGCKTRDPIIQHLNGVGNVMNLQWDAHKAYNKLKWGIDAQDDNGMVRTKSVCSD